MMLMLASRKSDNSFSQLVIIWSKLWFSLFMACWLSYFGKRTQRVCWSSGNVFLLRGLYTLVTEGPIFFWEVLGFDIGEVIIRFCHNQKWPIKSIWPRFNSTGSCQTTRGDNFHCRLDGRAVCPTLAASLAPSFSEPSRLRFIFLFFLTSVTFRVILLYCAGVEEETSFPH